ncbi:hypothetical protein RKD49_000182 [Streptomyces glaucescens]
MTTKMRLVGGGRRRPLAVLVNSHWPGVTGRQAAASLLRPDPAPRSRLEIRDKVIARIAGAERESWLGEIEGTQGQPRRRRG